MKSPLSTSFESALSLPDNDWYTIKVPKHMMAGVNLKHQYGSGTLDINPEFLPCETVEGASIEPPCLTRDDSQRLSR